MNIVKMWKKIKEKYRDRKVYFVIKSNKVIVKEDGKIIEVIDMDG